jgi:Mce-associated membrane protein
VAAGRVRVAGQRTARPRTENAPEQDEQIEPAEPVESVESSPRLPRPDLRIRLPRRRPRTEPPARNRLVVVSSALIVVFLVTGVVLGLRLVRNRQQSQDRAAVLRVVPRFATEVLSFDYRHLDDNAKAARPLLSGAYRQDYDKSMSEHATAWKKYHYVVKSNVASAGLSRISGSQAVVVAFVDQSVSAGTSKIGTAKDLIRLRFTVQHQNGTWLLTKLDSL